MHKPVDTAIPGHGAQVDSRGTSSDLGIGLEDRARRFRVSLTKRVATATLRSHLRDLATHLEAGDTPMARRDLALARKALSRIGGTDASDIVNDSTVRIVLDHAEALLNERAQPAPQPAPGRDSSVTSGPAPTLFTP